MNEIIISANRLPVRMSYGRKVIYQKDSAKGSAVDNYYYRPISCLLLIWKSSTGMVADEMSGFLEREKYQKSRRVVR